MAQRDDAHPYMSKGQLNDYLSSLRQGRNDPKLRDPSYRNSVDRSGNSTPLVQALKERHGSHNAAAPYVNVGISGRQSPTKRSVPKELPPVPGIKTVSSSGWRTKEERSQEPPPLPERSPSPPKNYGGSRRNDFWSTGVVRPLPPSPPRERQSREYDPRDDLRMPAIQSLSIDEPVKNPPPTNVPSINVPSINVPAPDVPSISVPSINEPSDSASWPLPESGKAEKSWPNTSVRSRHGPTLHCAICNKAISGRIVTAIGSRFHPECFRCATCRTELEHVAFFEHDSKVYCHLDYHELFSPRCKHCDTPIENEVISALGHKYHPGHFFCAGCGDPFGATTPFIVRDKYPWCERCYENKYAPKCAKCRKPVIDEVLNAMGKTWHPSGCFVCKECGRDFGDDGFFIDSNDNKPLCKSCKHIKLVRQVDRIRA